MNIDAIKEGVSQPKTLSWLVALFPILSFLVCMSLLGGSSEDVQAQPASNEAPPSIILVLVAILFLAKFVALVSLVRRWYYGWIYHLLEVNFLLFVFGLLIVIKILTTPLGVSGGVGIALSLASLYVDLYLKQQWLGRNARDYFNVSRLTHA
ncbi:MAG: hypothetical protein K6L81_16385 [Agarilytica sp.]